MKEQACQKREGGLLDVGLLMSCEVAMGWLMGVSILLQQLQKLPAVVQNLTFNCTTTPLSTTLCFHLTKITTKKRLS